jgi:hypothetical protein
MSNLPPPPGQPSSLPSPAWSVPPGVRSILPPPMPPPRQPSQSQPGPGAAVRSSRKTMIAVLGSAGGVLLLLMVTLLVSFVRHGGAKDAPRAIVRVLMKSSSGTGFFVQGPDDQAYVATAYHVVERGEPILIERTLDGSGGEHYVQAYPEAEVVAFDEDADLAIVRLKNVSRDQFPSLSLAKEPVADESILSFGFPASSLAQRFGMVSKPGKVLSLVKFPVIDRRSKEIVRNDAIDGLLVSTDIEPGFSGGPTCNEHGEVVGVNVTKDNVHRGQNGAVSVTALRTLLGLVKPAKEQKDPTPEELKALLSRIEREYLLLPMDRRAATRADDFVSGSDLPRVEELITTVRSLETNTARESGTKLSGRAMLGLTLARLPGKPLETYMDASTRKAMEACEARERGLSQFFGPLGASHDADTRLADHARAQCSELAFRPILWDLTALAMQWEGKERDISVTKLDKVDPERHVYRAAIRFSGIDHLVDVWFSTDGGRLRLKLFDNDGEASGMTAARSATPSAFQGTWHRSEPRTSHDVAKGVDADADTDETLVVAISTDGSVSASHQFRRHIYMTGARRLSCGGNKLDLGVEQSFAGSLHEGSVLAFKQKDAKPLGADMGRCWQAFTYSPDQVTVLKLVEDKLMMYRTDGVAYPEVAEFAR